MYSNFLKAFGCEESKLGRWIIVLCLLIYLCSAKGYVEILDTSYSLQTTEAIIERGELNIPHEEEFTYRGKNGLSYSKYGIGLAAYFIPWVACGHGIANITGLPEKDITGFLISFANIPVALFTLMFFNSLLLAFNFQKKNNYLMLLALGIGTLMWTYSTTDFSEQLQMLFLLIAITGVIKGTNRPLTFAGASFAVLILVKLIHVIVLPAFCIFVFFASGFTWRQRFFRLFNFMWPIAIGLMVILLLNKVRFGNFLESGYGEESKEFFPSQLRYTVKELLFSFNKGLLTFSPILYLAILGWRSFFKNYRKEALLFLSLVSINLLFNGAWWAWNGGWSWGPRLLIPFIPLWLLPLGFWLDKIKTKIRFRVASIVVVLSIMMQLPGVFVKMQQVPDIKDRVYTPSEYPFAPSQYKTATILFLHKLKGADEVYNVSDFGIKGDRRFDFLEHPTYYGFNIWTEQMARHFNKPIIRWILLPFLLCIFYCGFRIIIGLIRMK